MEKQILVQTFVDVSAGHDWFFEYSDDYKEWTMGRNHRDRIDAAFNSLRVADPVLARETWNKVAPDHYHRSIL